jgi:hypothetical protein
MLNKLKKEKLPFKASTGYSQNKINSPSNNIKHEENESRSYVLHEKLDFKAIILKVIIYRLLRDIHVK